MQTHRHAAVMLLRDWRAGDLRLIALAVLVAVAALTTVATFTDRVRRALELRATELLAADLVLESSNEIPAALIDDVHAAGLATTRTTSFRSMAVNGERMELAEVKAVETGYPLRGTLRVAGALFGAETAVEGGPASGSVWIDGRLFQALQAGIGDEIALGSGRFTVARILSYEPDRGGDLFNIAPRLMMNRADVAATGLLGPGSRVSHRLLLAGTGAEVEAFRARFESAKPAGISIHGIRDARPELRRALERAEQFLGLAMLVSAALCGLAIALAARSYSVRHYDTCAMLRCLGMRQRGISLLFLWQLLLLALLFSLAGCAIGWLAQHSLAALLRELNGTALPPPTWRPLLAGLIAGCVAVLGFALPQIWRLRNVPPLRVFRREAAPLPPAALTVYGAAILALAALTPWQSGNARITALVLLGLLASALLLWAAALAAVRASSRLRSRVGVAWRWGLANISRRSAGSAAQVLGIGLGATVILLLTLVRDDMLQSWRDRVPADAPNFFLINVQTDQVQPVADLLRREAQVEARLYPMIRGRLTRINEAAVDPDAYQDDRARRLAARDFNLSVAERMQPDNRLLSGSWWPRAGGEVWFSVEEGIAETLGIRRGDRIEYDIAGSLVSGTVRNLRFVEWDSFNVNFFVVANPGALDGHPATWITSFHLPEARRGTLIELVRAFPSVTIIDVAALLDQVRSIMDQVSRTVELVFAFTFAAGLLVLFAALNASHDERHTETALLRALGAGRGQIVAGLAAEFLALGAIAGLLAAAGATLIAWLLSRFAFELPFTADPAVWLLAPPACSAVILFSGLLATRSVLNVPPVQTLRRV
jgi:putative ABC transport system permease protein